MGNFINQPFRIQQDPIERKKSKNYYLGGKSKMYDYVLLRMAMYDYVRPCMTMCDYVQLCTTFQNYMTKDE